MTEPDDLELIRSLRDADRGVREGAFAALFARHRKRALDLAWRVLGDADLAADVVQEAFVSVYRKGDRFEERAQFTSWLHRVVLNRSIDLRRRERRHRGERIPRIGADASAGAADLEEVAAAGASPDAETEASERADLVRRAVDSLSPKLAEVVVLRYPRGMSYEEIGAVLGVPPGTVKSRLNRAHAALRGLLGRTLDELGPGAGPPPESPETGA